MNTAQSLLLVAPGELRWVTQDLPPLGPRDLLIETRSGAISLGTELPHYLGTSRNAEPPHYPSMTGYESVGVVLARGEATRRVQVGDRIVAPYGHRTHAVIPEEKAIVVPAGLGDELAVLVILSGDVATGIHKLGVATREPVLVTGAGAIGLLAVFVLIALGAPAVDVVEPLAHRHDLATAFGARRAIAPEDAALLDEAYAAGIECSSRDAAFALLQDRMRPHGRTCVIADGNVEPLTLAPVFHSRQLTIIGTSDCPDYHAHARWYFPAVQQTDGRLARIFDRRIVAADLPATFAGFASDKSTGMKVFVQYRPDSSLPD